MDRYDKMFYCFDMQNKNNTMSNYIYFVNELMNKSCMEVI